MIDQHCFPRDKACGDFVGPSGLAELNGLGLSSQGFFATLTEFSAALYLSTATKSSGARFHKWTACAGNGDAASDSSKLEPLHVAMAPQWAMNWDEVVKRSPFFGPERFTYQPEHNRYICPAGQPLNYGGRVYLNRAFAYIGTRKRCGACSLKTQCTSAPFRSLNIHQHEAARQRARDLASTPGFPKHSGKERSWKHFSRNSRIRSGCVAYACVD